SYRMKYQSFIRSATKAYRYDGTKEGMLLKKAYDWIVFDLGGVLVELQGFGFFDPWTKNKKDEAEFGKLWLKSPSVRLYEAGKISSTDYAQRLVREMKLTCTAEEFHKSYKNFIKGPFEGAFGLLKELKHEYKVACLSNTNDIHWEGLLKQYPMDSYFDKLFLSYRIGLLKPDREIFVHVIDELKVSPSRILFFDDNLMNVEAARQAGIEAFRVKGPKEIKSKLRELGVDYKD
ncbi:MAG: HAD family phosphatase, partial [Clostridia bacterium]|nr:HAD family phosphatase [Clostridia bacterium]